MENYANAKTNKKISLSIEKEKDHEQIAKISHALSNPERVKILNCILSSSKSLSTIATELEQMTAVG